MFNGESITSGEYYIFYQKVMLVVWAAIAVFVVAALTALLIVWFLEQVNKHVVAKKRDDSTAIAADMLWTNYNLVEAEKKQLEKKVEKQEKKIYSLLKWDKKRKKIIEQLEDQLVQYGLTPVTAQTNEAE